MALRGCALMAITSRLYVPVKIKYGPAACRKAFQYVFVGVRHTAGRSRSRSGRAVVVVLRKTARNDWRINVPPSDLKVVTGRVPARVLKKRFRNSHATFIPVTRTGEKNALSRAVTESTA